MKQFMKKILVSDYDQTFYINDEDIENNKMAVKEFRKKGNIFVIATGRSYDDFQRKAKEYDIKYDYLIINHGASILNEKEEILYNFPIKNEIIKNIKKDLLINIPDIIFYTNNIAYRDSNNMYFCCKEKLSRLDFNNNDLTKINIRLISEEKVDEINQIITDKYSDVINCYKVSNNIIEIISKEINKSKAIKLLADYYYLDKNEIYTIGDGYSDIQMIKDYNGFAIKDSVKELKNVAKKEYTSVSELINELI